MVQEWGILVAHDIAEHLILGGAVVAGVGAWWRGRRWLRSRSRVPK